MKVKYMLPILALGVITGCGYNRLEGSNFDTYIQNNGTPTSYYTLKNGNTLYFYRTRCTNSRNWEEYNVEVTSENVVVGKNYIKSCPYVSTVKPTSATEKELDTLLREKFSIIERLPKVSNEYMNAKTTKGDNHPDTLALKQKQDELRNREKELQVKIDNLKQQIQ